MADLFPLSVILHFPPEVYLSRGVGDLCPLLVRASHANKSSALQFLRGGRVREPAFREELLSNDLMFEDRKISVTPAGVHVITVYVRDLPVELSEETVKFAFSSYGEVYSVSHGHFTDFPDLRNGNRLILMSVCNPIPSSLNVLGFVCRTWHPVHCIICKESGHLPRACPLSGLCRRCKQPSHVARECGQAEGQPRPLPLPLLLLLPLLLFQLILFLTTLFLFLFLLLVPRMTGTCPLSPRTILIYLFRPIRPLPLMIILAPSIPNVFRPSQPTAFPFSSPKVPVIPKSKSVSFRK